MILVVDNYDSFTYNLVQYLGELGAEVTVWRADKFGLDEVEELAPQGIVISPGPGIPEDAGQSIPVIRRFGPRIPILGVCLGHQAIGVAYGARVVRAPRIMHGKVSLIRHEGEGVLAGLPSPFPATRYHSLVVAPDTVPEDLRITAWSEDDGQIMAIAHREHPVEGVQFHPESILTRHGHDMLRNFLRRCAG